MKNSIYHVAITIIKFSNFFENLQLWKNFVAFFSKKKKKKNFWRSVQIAFDPIALNFGIFEKWGRGKYQ